jgi:hypothetical protein
LILLEIIGGEIPVARVVSGADVAAGGQRMGPAIHPGKGS